MRKPKGYNPMRYDCAASGCFNLRRRPKIELFADCFPGHINFGDVDGLVERYEKLCLLEWKGVEGGAIGTGQRITYESITKTFGNIVFIVFGDALSMDVYGFQIVWNGHLQPYIEGGIGPLKERIKSWAEWVEEQHRASIAAVAAH